MSSLATPSPTARRVVSQAVESRLLTVAGLSSIHIAPSQKLEQIVMYSVKWRQPGLFKWSLTCCLCLTLTATHAAEPFRPQTDAEILERLPRVWGSQRSQLSTLCRQLAQDRNNSELAVAVASNYLRIGNLDGDPRFYGYARAALQPWWNDEQAEAEVLMLRAKLKEKDHQFDQSLADLQLVTQAQPDHVQAWTEMASIYGIQGRYSLAMHACDRLSEYASESQSSLCRIPIQAMSGKAKSAYEKLNSIADEAQQSWPAAASWIVAMQSQIAWSLGLDEQAQRHFRVGSANHPADKYLLRQYADFLIDRGRNTEAISLLRDHLRDNGILLRTAIAAKRDGQLQLAGELQSQLAKRFEEIRLRGDQPHGRFESRFELELNDNPIRALEIALDNWKKQKQIRDTRNVLEAALAADQAAAARPVLEFLAENQTEDLVLTQLAEKLTRQSER